MCKLLTTATLDRKRCCCSSIKWPFQWIRIWTGLFIWKSKQLRDGPTPLRHKSAALARTSEQHWVWVNTGKHQDMKHRKTTPRIRILCDLQEMSSWLHSFLRMSTHGKAHLRINEAEVRAASNSSLPVWPCHEQLCHPLYLQKIQLTSAKSTLKLNSHEGSKVFWMCLTIPTANIHPLEDQAPRHPQVLL